MKQSWPDQMGLLWGGLLWGGIAPGGELMWALKASKPVESSTKLDATLGDGMWFPFPCVQM